MFDQEKKKIRIEYFFGNSFYTCERFWQLFYETTPLLYLLYLLTLSFFLVLRWHEEPGQEGLRAGKSSDEGNRQWFSYARPVGAPKGAKIIGLSVADLGIPEDGFAKSPSKSSSHLARGKNLEDSDGDSTVRIFDLVVCAG